MNPLDNYPAVRRAAYFVQWVVNLSLGVVGIVLTANGESPQWFIITGAVFNFVWTYTGLTAQVNTDASLDRATESFCAETEDVSGNDE